jgi:cation:H+ antiporter
MYISALIVGILLLVWSADRFIDGSAKLAKRLRFPTLIIGMVVVGFGTSAPEMVVSATAAWQGDAALALGNAIGSNIINITLILGVTALLTPLALNQRVLKKEMPFLIAISLLSGFIFWDLKVTRLEGGILLVVLMVFLFWMLKVATGGKNEATEEKIDLKKAIFWIFFGLILLIFSSKILLWGAKNLA